MTAALEFGIYPLSVAGTPAWPGGRACRMTTPGLALPWMTSAAGYCPAPTWSTWSQAARTPSWPSVTGTATPACSATSRWAACATPASS